MYPLTLAFDESVENDISRKWTLKTGRSSNTHTDKVYFK
jgi:hypothetical protein